MRIDICRCTTCLPSSFSLSELSLSSHSPLRQPHSPPASLHTPLSVNLNLRQPLVTHSIQSATFVYLTRPLFARTLTLSPLLANCLWPLSGLSTLVYHPSASTMRCLVFTSVLVCIMSPAAYASSRGALNRLGLESRDQLGEYPTYKTFMRFLRENLMNRCAPAI